SKPATHALNEQRSRFGGGQGFRPRNPVRFPECLFPRRGRCDMGLSSDRSGWLTMIGVLLPPVVAIATLSALMHLFGIKASPQYAVLHVVAFLVSLVVYREVAAVATTYARRPLDFFQRSIGAWAIVVGCLAVVGFAVQESEFFSRRVLLSWGVVTPIAIAAFQYWTYVYFVQNPARARNVVIAGVSDLSKRLAHAITSQPATGLALRGFFDDRDHTRLGPIEDQPLLGRLSDLPRYAKEKAIDVIYIALPIRRED